MGSDDEPVVDAVAADVVAVVGIDVVDAIARPGAGGGNGLEAVIVAHDVAADVDVKVVLIGESFIVRAHDGWRVARQSAESYLRKKERNERTQDVAKPMKRNVFCEQVRHSGYNGVLFDSNRRL